MNTPLLLCVVLLTLFVIVSAQKIPLKDDFVLFFFRRDCYELFFTKFDFTNAECLKITISKGLGYAIIAGSAILKVPQILKIVKAGSVEGISKSLFYLETLTLLHAATYSIR
jgi:mannose-P-dolichol utilization defect protein 1